jgi:hypothetical protein
MSATLRDAESVFLAPPFERKGGRGYRDKKIEPPFMEALFD